MPADMDRHCRRQQTWTTLDASALVVRTPSGDERISRAEWTVQANRAMGAMVRANIRGCYTVQDYIARYGLLGPHPNDFGDDVFTGLQAEFAQYPWNYRFYATGTIYMAWFWPSRSLVASSSTNALAKEKDQDMVSVFLDRVGSGVCADGLLEYHRYGFPSMEGSP